ncbi:MAG: hypothetical protein ACFHW5_14470 [Verrucomicrobiota bacterium]
MIRSFLSNPSRLLLATWFIATLGTGRSQTQEADPLQDSLSLTPSAWAPGLVAGTSAQFQLRFFTDAAGWNGRPVGLWSDGTTIWSSDWGLLSKLFAYSISGARDHAHDFDSLTPAGNRSPRGIWSDGKTMWVCDDFEDRLFAYDLSTTTRQPEKEFDSLLPAGNTEATGIWSDGTIMWVADAKDTKIYAYDLATTQRLPNRDINNLEADGNLSPSDIWSNGTTLYVADKGGFKPWSGTTYGKIFAYDLATGKRDAAKDLDYQSLREAGVTSPAGLWSNGSTMWVSDWRQGRVYAAQIAAPTPMDDIASDTSRNRDLDWDSLAEPGNIHPTGIWSDGATLWSADIEDNMIYAYNATTGERNESLDLPKELLESAGNGSPTGICSDGLIMYVVDDVDDHVYAYSLSTLERVPQSEISSLSATGNHWPRGMFILGQTLWIADWEDHKIYAYDLASGQAVPELDFNTLENAGNKAPSALWSDGDTMWVADWEDDKVYAYSMQDKSRIVEKEFDSLKTAGNLSPSGMWSDGKALIISDFADARFYGYWLSKEAPASIQSIQLSTDGKIVVEFTGKLLSSARVEGPYSVIQNATSPYSFFPHNKQVFFIAD